MFSSQDELQLEDADDEGDIEPFDELEEDEISGEQDEISGEQEITDGARCQTKSAILTEESLNSLLENTLVKCPTCKRRCKSSVTRVSMTFHVQWVRKSLCLVEYH